MTSRSEDVGGRTKAGAPPLTILTFTLELPYALPIPETLSVAPEPRTPAWDGWSAAALGRLLSRAGEVKFADDQVPGTRFAFRSFETTGPVPLLGASEAFACWVEPVLTRKAVKARRKDLKKWRKSGFTTVRSAVALTRFIPRSEHPVGKDMTVAWLLNVFRGALSDLNELLEAMGIIGHRWDIGPLAAQDLPARLPVLFESTHLNGEMKRQGTTTLLHLHDSYPAIPELFEPKQDFIEQATWLDRQANAGRQPFMLVFRLMQSATRQRLAGDPTQAVIDLNTAIEVLVSVVLREGGRVLNWDQEMVDRVTSYRTGFKKRLCNYLSQVVGEDIKPDDAQTAWGEWIEVGYHARNAAIHEGEALDRGKADEAFLAANGVLEYMNERLAGDSRFKALGETLTYKLGTNSPWEQELAGVRFPWD